MATLYALILAFAVISTGLAVLALVRGAPATLRARCEQAEAAVIQLRNLWESFHSETLTVLSSIAEERERALKAQARVRSERQRVEQSENGRDRPMSRTEKLDDLRRRSGILADL